MGTAHSRINRLIAYFRTPTVHYSPLGCIFAATDNLMRKRQMRASLRPLVLAVALGSASLSVAQAQAAPANSADMPVVGDMAPDFAMQGATRYGLLRESVRLSDFRGQTVVLAFFARARTRG